MDVTEHILEEVDGLIVVNKPDDVPTAGNKLDEPGSLQFELMEHYRRMIWAVHQIDKDTSGLNLFVRRKKLVHHWAEQLKAGTKTYLAFVDGRFAHKRLHIREPIGFDNSKKVRGVTLDGKDSHSEVHLVAHGEGASLVKVLLHTGRTHQIRIHLAHIGHPLVGDQWYGDENDNRMHRHALHAWRIDTPEGSFEAPIPADFQVFAEDAGFELGDALQE